MEKMSSAYVGSYTTASPSRSIETCEGGSCTEQGCFPTFPNNKFFNNGYTWIFLLFTIIVLVIVLMLINSTSGQNSPWFNSMNSPWPFGITWMVSFLIVVMIVLFWLACSFGTCTEPRVNCVGWGFFLILIILVLWCMAFYWKHMFGLSLAFLVLGVFVALWLGWVFGVSDGFKITALVLLCVFALFWIFLIYYTGGYWYLNPQHNGMP